MNAIFKTMCAATGVAAWVSGMCVAAEGWETDFNRGLETAAAEGRTALVEFTGSDWCPPCMMVRSKVLPTADFKDFAAKNNLVLIELDFPRGKDKVTPEVRREREEIAAKYQISGYPTMLVTDGTGRAYGKVEGAPRTPADYVNELQMMLNLKGVVEAELAKAEGLTGVERAKALLTVLETLPEDCRALWKDVAEEILSNDPEDTTGYRKAEERKKLKNMQVREFREGLVRRAEEARGDNEFTADMKKVVAATREEALKTLERKDLLPEVVQVVLGFISESYLVEKNYAQAVEYLDKAIEAAPESPEVPQLQKLRVLMMQRLEKK